MRANLRQTGLTLAVWAITAPALAQPSPGPPQATPPAADSVRLLLALNDDTDLGLGVEMRLKEYIVQAAGSAAQPTSAKPTSARTASPRPIVLEWVSLAGQKLDADDDADKVAALIASHGAHAALIGDVARRDDTVVTHASLSVPVEPQGAETWVATSKNVRVALPLAEGVYRFDSINISASRVADATATQSPDLLSRVNEFAGDVTKVFRVNRIPGVRQFYTSTTTISEQGAARFIAATLAYHAGDFAQAASQFAEAEKVSEPGSTIRRDAAVLRLAATARDALATASGDGEKPLGHWSRAVDQVNTLGKDTLAEFPWSTDARKVLVMFHLSVAIAAPDALFNGALTRSFEASEARRYATSIEKLQGATIEWSAQARRVADMISP
jgi:hypothetical protein